MKVLALAWILIHGFVLAVNRSGGTVVLKHDAFGGMPAMTMTFSVSPADARKLSAGDEIRGSVDRSVEPWRLRVSGVVASAPQTDTGAEPPIPILRPGDTVPDANFVDQFSHKRSWRWFRGHTTVVSFIYTRCRDAAMCPLVSAKFGQLQRTLPKNARLLEVTLDPGYDTPDVLRQYGAMFGAEAPQWTLATGSAQAIGRIAAGFGIGVSSHSESTIVHSEVLGIIDRSGTVARIVAGNTWQPDEVVAAVREAEGLRSNPWERFVLGVRYAVNQCGLGNMSLAHAAEFLIFLAATASIAVVVFVFDFISRRRRSKKIPTRL